MSLVINHNMMAMNATRNLNETYGKLATSTRRLSSGLRVGTAADDAAGLAMRELMRADIDTLGQGLRNANDGISMIQTADGALQVIDAKLIRMKELAEQAATGTYTDVQRQMIDDEYQAMSEEITRISLDTDFNSLKLLSGFAPDLPQEQTFAGTIANLDTPPTAGDTAPDSGTLQTTATRPVTATVSLVKKDSTGFTITAEASITANAAVTTPPALAAATGTVEYSYDENGIPVFTPDNSDATKNTTDVTVTYTMEKQYPLAGSTAPSYEISADGGKTWKSYDPDTDGAITLDETSQLRVTSTFGKDGDFIETFKGSDVSFDETNKKITITATDKEALDSVISKQYSSASGKNVDIHFGSSSEETDGYAAYMGEVSSRALGLGDSAGDNVRSAEAAKTALDNITNAIRYKDKIRAGLGATQNRLSATIENVTIQRENLQASESRISDVDIATEMTEFTRNQVMSQAAVSMLAQANSLPKMAQKLLEG